MSHNPLKRARSSSPAPDKYSKRRAISSWVNEIEDLPDGPVPHCTPSEYWNESDSMAAPRPASSVRTATNRQSSSAKAGPMDIDYGPTLELLEVLDANAEDDGPMPENWGELRAILYQARSSPGASKADEEFVRRNVHRPGNEEQFATLRESY